MVKTHRSFRLTNDIPSSLLQRGNKKLHRRHHLDTVTLYSFYQAKHLSNCSSLGGPEHESIHQPHTTAGCHIS